MRFCFFFLIDIWAGVFAVQAGGHLTRVRPHGPFRWRNFFTRRCFPPARPVGGHRLLNQEHRPRERKHACATRLHTRQTRSWWGTSRRMRYTTAQSSRDQDGEAMHATDVCASAATTSIAAPTGNFLCQVPTIEARVHVTLNTSQFRAGKSWEHHAGKSYEYIPKVLCATSEIDGTIFC